MSVNQTCFSAECERKPFTSCVSGHKIVNYNGPPSTIGSRYKTDCILCNDTDHINDSSDTYPTGKCFPGVEWLVLKGMKYEKLSSEKLASIDSSLLISLFIIDSEITEINRATFKDFLALDSLNLDDNKLTHIPRNWYGVYYPPRDYYLTHLSISKNNISSLEEGCFEHLKELIMLDLSGNALQEIRSHWFTGLSALTMLYLNDNKIKTIQDNAFESLKEIHHLDLTNNDLVRLQSEALSTLSNRRIASVVLGGRKLQAQTVHSVEWRVEIVNCNYLTKQWVQLHVADTGLNINYHVDENTLVIDWFSIHGNIRSNSDECKPLSKEFRLGSFTASPPFVVIATTDEDRANQSFSTRCLGAWNSPGGISLALRGASSLRLSSADLSSKNVASDSVGLLLVAKAHTDFQRGRADSESNREFSAATVPCFALIRDVRRVWYFNVSTERHADDAICTFGKAVQNGTTLTVVTNTASMKTAPNVAHEREKDASVTPQTSVVANGVTATDFWVPLIVSTVLAVLCIITCVVAMFSYRKRRRGNQNQGNCRPVQMLSLRAACALQSNPMYSHGGNTQKTPQTESTQDSSKTDDNVYNQINEDEVYDASEHDYYEIKDEDACRDRVLKTSQTEDNVYNQINEGEVYDPSAHDYYNIKEEVSLEQGVVESSCEDKDDEIGQEDFNDASEEVSQNGNETDEDSVTFYAATAEVGLPLTRNVGGNTSLYQSESRTTSHVECRPGIQPVSRTVDQEQTAYNMAGSLPQAGRHH
uniref:Uncharacterized protein n=1 Tax=Branchiostoma floridae TaxID=7739 RepID=C3XQ17_BRAFL|eukprot:XP_002614029.1 hypothetical protein BRAFLDRAFT_67387 [Branchiostoma floridae]